jgi:glc operon protein GlcG
LTLHLSAQPVNTPIARFGGEAKNSRELVRDHVRHAKAAHACVIEVKSEPDPAYCARFVADNGVTKVFELKVRLDDVPASSGAPFADPIKGSRGGVTSPIQMLSWGQIRASALCPRGSTVLLSLEDANRVMHGALAKARELNVRVSVAIFDAGGRLFAFQRMENSILASVFASQGKAITSVIVGRPSGDVPDPKDNPALVGVVAAAGGILIAGKGGFPLLRDGSLWVRAAGAAWDQDEMCARAGVEHF